jgi:N-acetylglucosamine-6-sulfatase
MDRRDFLRRVGLAGAGVSSGLTSLARPARAQAASGEPRPNVLFIFTDDQPPHTIYQMSRTLARFAGGLNLTETGYVPVPLCGPARASFFTGVYPHTHRVLLNEHSLAYDVYRQRGYPTVDIFPRMRAAGYRLGFFGKFINGYGEVEGGNRWVHPAFRSGRVRWAALADKQGHIPYMVNTNGNLHDEVQNHTPYFGKEAEAFILNSAPVAPWFCYLPWTDPHVPYTPRFPHTHDGARYTSPGVREEDITDKTYPQTSRRAGPAYQQEHYEGILEELVAVDRWVERLFLALEHSGQLDNTIVIFSSDNGYMLGEHGGMTRKGHPYEESARIPFLIRGPGISASTAPESPLVSHLDITATILAAARADMSGIDGRDLRDLGSSSGAWRKRLLVEHPGKGWRMVRDGRWIYMDLMGETVEMYDLALDPYQLENRAGEGLIIEQELAARLASLRSATGDALRAAEE